jgi:hypothetical protein
MDDYIEEANKATPPILPALNRLNNAGALQELRLVVIQNIKAAKYADQYRKAIYLGKRPYKRLFMFWYWPRKNNKDEIERVRQEQIAELLQAALGMVAESSEFLEQVYAHIHTGRPLDQVHLRETNEGLLWYIAKAAKWLRTTFPMMMAMNIGKMKYLHPDKYYEEKKTSPKTGA